MPGCRITFFFVANCEAFEIIGTSGPARVNTILNSYSGPQPGKVYSLQLQQGDVIEIQSAGTSLNATNNGPQVLIAYIGQATSGDATHLNDTNRNWPLGWFAYNNGAIKRSNLVILSGSGAGKSSAITDNTATSLTFDAVAGMVPDNSSEYAIVWNLGNGISSGSILPMVFVVPETGAYSVEITPSLGFKFLSNNPYGRATYFKQDSALNKPSVPVANAVSSTYDSTRDCVWILDHVGHSALGVVYLVSVNANGTQLTRTNIGAFGQGVIVYCPVNDRLAIADTHGNLIIVDPSTQTVESTTALALPGNTGNQYLGAFCPDNNCVYLPTGQVVDPVAKTLVASIAGVGLGVQCPILVASDNNIWYVSSFSTSPSDINVVDPGTNAIIHNINLPGSFNGGQMAYVPSTGLVYGPSTSEPTGMAVFNPTTYAFVRNTLLDQSTFITGIVYRPEDGFLYAGVSCYASLGDELCELIKIDPATETIVDRILCPPQPQIFHLSSAGNLFITGFGNASFSAVPYNAQSSVSVHAP